MSEIGAIAIAAALRLVLFILFNLLCNNYNYCNRISNVYPCVISTFYNVDMFRLFALIYFVVRL